MTDTTMAAAPSSLRIGRVFNRAFAVLSGDFIKFFLLAVIILSPYLLATLLLPQLGATAARGRAGSLPSPGLIFGGGAFAILWGALAILGQAAALYGAIQKMRGQEFSIGESLGRGLQRFFPIIGMGICDALGSGLAALLFVIPGIMLFVSWRVALPACVAERLGPIESLKRSSYLTRGNRWRVFGIMVVLIIVSAIAQGVIQYGLTAIAGKTISTIGAFVWMALFQSFDAIVIAVMYHDLRVAREGVDIEHIAAVFD
jgi:hypothetical protein